MVYKYVAFGLNIICDFQLSKFNTHAFDTAADVTIKLGKTIPYLPNGVRAGQYSQISPEDYLLDLPGHVKFYVHKGRLITIENSGNLSDLVLQNHLFGTVFTNILQYRGYLVLHGSAIKIGNKAIIFSGESGAGKSTLAAAFMQRGYTMLTDDLVVLAMSGNGKLTLIPGPSRFKLLQDAIDRLNISSNNIAKIEHKFNKYEVSITRDPHIENIEVGSFYELNSHEHAY